MLDGEILIGGVKYATVVMLIFGLTSDMATLVSEEMWRSRTILLLQG